MCTIPHIFQVPFWLYLINFYPNALGFGMSLLSYRSNFVELSFRLNGTDLPEVTSMDNFLNLANSLSRECNRTSLKISLDKTYTSKKSSNPIMVIFIFIGSFQKVECN